MTDSIVQQMYQRKMFRITAGYLAVAWLAWQVVGTTCPASECSMAFQKSVFWFLVAGLPATLAVAWLNWRTAIIVGIALFVGAMGSLWLQRIPTAGLVPVAAPATGAIIGGSESSGEETSVAGLGGRPAVAVLPFENLSADRDQAYFADGLAEDLITRLSSWRAFPVIARSSSFLYRDAKANSQEVAAELGVRYIVEGSVRRAENRIRVAAQLIDATSGEHVWAEIYDREVTDVFALQDEISTIIAASLVGDLIRAEGARVHQRGTEDLEAWSVYQLGLQHADRFNYEDFTEARRLFEKAAELDARFATALGQAAIAGYAEMMLAPEESREPLIAGIMRNARRAVELDPRDPAAHLGLAGYHLAVGELTNAVEAIDRVVELNPSMPEAWIWLGFIRILAGNPEGAVQATHRAQQLNPRGPMVWIYDNFALAYWELGRYEEALDAARRLVATHPTYPTGYAYIAMNEVALGDIDSARAAIVEGRRIHPDLSLAKMQNYLGVSRPEIDARRNDALRQAGLH